MSDSTAEATFPGSGILMADIVGTAALAVVSVVTGVVGNDATEVASLVVAAALFGGGCLAFAVGFWRALGRSRTEVVDLAGIFWLTGSAPAEVARRLRGLLVVQSLVAVASVAAVRPPFAIMAPVWGIGLITLWASRHATFPARPRVRGAYRGPTG
ncbi:MAG: hypothetical protein ACR2MB_01760 [Acidimicrobiales bacterium]